MRPNRMLRMIVGGMAFGLSLAVVATTAKAQQPPMPVNPAPMAMPAPYTGEMMSGLPGASAPAMAPAAPAPANPAPRLSTRKRILILLGLVVDERPGRGSPPARRPGHRAGRIPGLEALGRALAVKVTGDVTRGGRRPLPAFDPLPLSRTRDSGLPTRGPALARCFVKEPGQAARASSSGTIPAFPRQDAVVSARLASSKNQPGAERAVTKPVAVLGISEGLRTRIAGATVSPDQSK